MKNVMIMFFFITIVSFVCASERMEFLVNHEYFISAYIPNDKFCYSSAECINKNIIELLAFTEEHKENMERAFKDAANNNITTRSFYNFRKKNFSMIINPFKKKQKILFRVVITESPA